MARDGGSRILNGVRNFLSNALTRAGEKIGGGQRDSGGFGDSALLAAGMASYIAHADGDFAVQEKEVLAQEFARDGVSLSDLSAGTGASGTNELAWVFQTPPTFADLVNCRKAVDLGGSADKEKLAQLVRSCVGADRTSSPLERCAAYRCCAELLEDTRPLPMYVVSDDQEALSRDIDFAQVISSATAREEFLIAEPSDSAVYVADPMCMGALVALDEALGRDWHQMQHILVLRAMRVAGAKHVSMGESRQEAITRRQEFEASLKLLGIGRFLPWNWGAGKAKGKGDKSGNSSGKGEGGDNKEGKSGDKSEEQGEGESRPKAEGGAPVVLQMQRSGTLESTSEFSRYTTVTFQRNPFLSLWAPFSLREVREFCETHTEFLKDEPDVALIMESALSRRSVKEYEVTVQYRMAETSTRRLNAMCGVLGGAAAGASGLRDGSTEKTSEGKAHLSVRF